METILGYLGIACAGLALLSILPITKEVVRPILSSFGEFVVWVGKELGSWLIFLIKTIMKSHTDFFDHLSHSDEHFDSEKMVKKIGQK